MWLKLMRFSRFLPFVLEALVLLISQPWRVADLDRLAGGLADIMFRGVDLGTAGLASRVVDPLKLTRAVRAVVDVFEGLFQSSK